MSPGTSLVRKLRKWTRRLARWQPPPRVRRYTTGVAAVVFVGATVTAVWNLTPLSVDVRWLALAGSLAVFVPVLNAFEYMLAGRWLGIDVAIQDALSVTVVASAANMAPLPGAAMVRGQSLLASGASPAGVARALATVGAAWVGVALLVAGGSLHLGGRQWMAGGTALIGCGALACIAVLLPGEGRTDPVSVSWCLMVELAAVTLQGVRLALILVGLGFEGRLAQTLILPAAGALANAAGVVPGGLGLRELIAGAVSPLVALSAERGITATAADRILSLAILAVASVAVSLAFSPQDAGGA